MVCGLIFLVALGVRLLHWQDTSLGIMESDTLGNNLGVLYHDEAQRILNEGGILFPNGKIDADDARPIIHPPGNSILMAVALRLFSDADKPMRWLQIICASVSAVLVFFIAAELLPLSIGIIAAMLVAFSPHLGYYSIWLSPDSTAVLPILVAILLLIKVWQKPRLSLLIAAGAMIGVSCWLRANALLLTLFLAVLLFFLFQNQKKWRYAFALIASTFFAVAPITIRNWVVYHHFIPVSLGTGVTLIEGIANYDTENRFGLPIMDAEVGIKEAEWYNRPEYAGSLWYPDGIEREQLRVKRGVATIRENPIWFLSVMLRRMSFMVRYNDFETQEMPYNTTIAPAVSASPTFSHLAALNNTDLSPQTTLSAVELIRQSTSLSPEAEIRLNSEERIEIVGDASAQNDQAEIARFAVHPNTDYLLSLAIQAENGDSVIKVKTDDPRITLALEGVSKLPTKKRKARKQQDLANEENKQQQFNTMKIPFSSGDNKEIRVILANNTAPSAKPTVRIEKVELYELSNTASQWTRFPRSIIRGMQKNLYKTDLLRWLIILGITLLLLARHHRVLLILLVVPIYYLLLQSTLHTEYRYILAIHYFLFILASIPLYILSIAFWQLCQLAYSRFRNTTTHTLQ